MGKGNLIGFQGIQCGMFITLYHRCVWHKIDQIDVMKFNFPAFPFVFVVIIHLRSFGILLVVECSFTHYHAWKCFPDKSTPISIYSQSYYLKFATLWIGHFCSKPTMYVEGEMGLQHVCDHVWSVITHKRRHHSCEKYIFSEIRDHKFHKYLSLHKHVDQTYHAPDLHDAWPLALSYGRRKMGEKCKM